jgi:hypothetical protein
MVLRLTRAASNLLVIFSLIVVASLFPLAAPAASSAGSGGQDACPDAHGLEGAERALDINGLMRQQKIPGMSLALIENFRIVCAKGMASP